MTIESYIMVNVNKRIGRGVAAVAHCIKICGLLAQDLYDDALPVQIHSQFNSATNLTTSHGMVTVLATNKCLQPYSLVLGEAIDFEQLPSRGLSISRTGIFSDKKTLISFQGATVIDLHLKKLLPLQSIAAKAIKSFLADKSEQGLVSLVFSQPAPPYADFLQPRIDAFRGAMKSHDTNHIIDCVRKVAGCGAGLTPSSDDFLCGYLACLPSNLAQDYAQPIALAAADKTNDISAALLIKAGMGYFSEDILALIGCLTRQTSDAALRAALAKVADFGSSSGCDFLVGMYFGILDFYENGGK